MPVAFTKSHRTILTALRSHTSLTPLELHLLTNLTNNSIRGRLSELRHMGYTIELTTLPSKKYQYTPASFFQNLLLTYLETNHLLGRPIPLKTLSTHLALPPAQTELILASLFTNPSYHVTQINSTTIAVTKTKHI